MTARTLAAALAAATGTAVAFLTATAPETSVGQEQPTLNLVAGLGEGVFSWNDFLRSNVRVAEGTTVVWTVASDEPHTVTFLAGGPRPGWLIPQPEDTDLPPMLDPGYAFPIHPRGPWDGMTYIHSGELGRGQRFQVTFSRQGRYEYVCLLHPPMAGAVDVVAAGSPGLTTEADVQRSVAGDTARMAPLMAEIMATASTSAELNGPGGTRIWAVRAGASRRAGRLDAMAFLPQALTIREGDTVLWYVDHVAPHTVTFPVPGQGHPDLIVATLPEGEPLPPDMAPPAGHGQHTPMVAPPDPSTARLVVGPGGRPFRPKATYDGASFYNSGLIGEHPGITVNLDKVWALTFDTPGDWEYLCVVHDPAGMKGRIAVLPRAD